jgi:putative phosphoesterase
MKIALLSDVHANLPALDAALEFATSAGAERVIVAGDLVGDGPDPVPVVARLRAAGAECVRGNVDRRVVKWARGEKKLAKKAKRRKSLAGNRAWTALQLRAAVEEMDWLARLRAEMHLRLLGHDILVVHGSPLGDTDYVYPSITSEGLAAKLSRLEGLEPSILVCGHSHIPFSREIDGVLVVNCGSVGRPADGDPRGSMALLELEEDRPPTVQMVRFGYDVRRLIEQIEEREVPGIDPEEYRSGVKG